MRKMLPAFVMLSLTACAGQPAIVTTPPARCADLIPVTWRDGIEATPVPDLPAPTGNALNDALAAVKGWAGAYVGMDGQLEKANGRTADTIAIVQRCEKMVNDARPR